jgi:hypothetical protein
MNAQFCVLPIGGKTRVVTFGDDPEFAGQETIIMSSPLEDFRQLHDKYRVRYQTTDSKGKTKSVEIGAGTWWLGNPRRRQYDKGMRFMPESDEERVNGGILNLWKGFSVEARKPNGYSGERGCNLLLRHGRRIICSGDEEHFDYLMKREAFIAQRRIRSEIALGLRTDQEGTGKGFWCRALNHLYGPHAMEVNKPEHVTGKHNPHLEKLLRLTADEALFALNPQHRNSLYNMITEPRITIEPKFVNAYAASNYLNIDIVSNAKHFIPVSGKARRFFVPTVSADRANDHAYFERIAEQLQDGGYEALLYHLLHEIDIRDFNVRDVPKTAALAEQAAYSRTGVDLLVEAACSEGVVPCPQLGFPNVSDCSGDRGFDYFVTHHSDRDIARMGTLMIKRRLTKDWGCVTGKSTRKMVNGMRLLGIIWPPLQELRERFEERHGPQQWLRPQLQDWQTRNAKCEE